MSDDPAGPEPVAIAPRRPLGSLLQATLSITLGALPVFMVGALAVFIRKDLGFSEAALGAAVSIYYASSALASVPGGKASERLGGKRAMGLAAAGSAIAMGGIAVLTSSWMVLVLFLVVAGFSNGLALPASNLALASGIPGSRLGMAFGFKQSAGPIAALLAGASVPVFGLTVGWKWAFAAAGLAALPLIVSGIRASRASPGLRPSPALVPRGPLVILAVAAAFAVFGGSSLGAFYVESAVAADFTPAFAGVLLAAGSAAGIAIRVGWGWIADNMDRGRLQLVGWLLIVGAVGFALLGFASTPAMLVAATLVVFATGWAWPALFYFAVVTRISQAPGLATGITGTGLFAGGIVGPVVFGSLVVATTYRVAWSFVAAGVVLAGVLVWIGDARLRTHPDGG